MPARMLTLVEGKAVLMVVEVLARELARVLGGMLALALLLAMAVSNCGQRARQQVQWAASGKNVHRHWCGFR